MTEITRAHILDVLSRHIGKGNGLTVSQVVELITRRASEPHDERMVRRLVVDLRKEGHHLCAHPKHGYYIAANDKELDECCEYLLDRSMTTLKQISAMRRVSMPDLRGQLKLPT